MFVLGHCKSLVSAPSATTGPRPCTVIHFYRTHTSNKTMSLLLSLCSLLTCHFLDTKQMRSSMLTSLCQLHKNDQKHMSQEVFTSRHGLFAQISLSVGKTLKRFKHQNMFHDVFLRFVGNGNSECLQNVALFHH